MELRSMALTVSQWTAWLLMALSPQAVCSSLHCVPLIEDSTPALVEWQLYSSVEVDVSNSDSIVVNVTSTFSPVLCSGIHVHVYTTCLHVIVISLCPSVPAPAVSVSLNTNGPLYQGTVLVFSCTATVDSAVNTGFTVDITLTSEPDTLNGRYVSITETSDSELEFSRTVEVRPVNTTDSATYTCTASIAPTASDSDSVLASTSNTDTVSITVEGESAQEVHVLSDSKQFSS